MEILAAGFETGIKAYLLKSYAYIVIGISSIKLLVFHETLL